MISSSPVLRAELHVSAICMISNEYRNRLSFLENICKMLDLHKKSAIISNILLV